MTKLTALQAIGAGVVKRVIADNITVGGTTFLGVWPRGTTDDQRPDAVSIYPITGEIFHVMNVNNSVMPVPASTGRVAAWLHTGETFKYIDPSVQTLGFVPAADSQNVDTRVTWYVLR